MQDFLQTFKSQVETHISKLQEDLKGIRTGRAHAGMIENLQIEAYGGSKMRLIELASIAAESTEALVIIPFDPSIVSDIEKGILKSPLGINPQTEGRRIVLRIPPLSQEQRVKYAKLVAQLVEETKNKIRRERDFIRKKIKSDEEQKLITKDEKYRSEKSIDENVNELNIRLQSIKEHKENEIMAV